MKDIYESITNRFVEQLKAGTVPWRKPWLTMPPQNLVSHKPYHGINAILLGFAPYGSPYWMTFKQCLQSGGTVQKGEKSRPIIYYKFLEKRGSDGRPVFNAEGKSITIPFIRWSNVFNLEQTKDIEAPAIRGRDFAPLEKAASIVDNAKLCPIRHVGNVAQYLPDIDVIHSPQPESFRTSSCYFHTIFHELTHATGAASRLNREGVTQPVEFGSERYCKEELIGELGASFLSNEAAILDKVQFDNSAAYLQSWVKRLENDPKLIISAASQAQRAADFVLGIEQKESVTESQLAPTESPSDMAAAPAQAVYFKVSRPSAKRITPTRTRFTKTHNQGMSL